MARGGSAGPHEPEEEQICPLCINELDETEKAWLPCSCGYQLCLFCYDRLKTEFSNRCPNCRVEYDSDFQAGLRRRQERVAQLQKEAAAAREAAAAAPKAPPAAAVKQHGAPPPPPPRSPRRDLHIEQERAWPSLGAAAAQQQAQQAQRQQQLQQAQQAQASMQQQQQPQQAQPPPQPGGPAGGRRADSPPHPAAAAPLRLAPIVASRSLHAEPEASSSSSANTAATTPQSPASSVVCFRAAHLPPSCGSTLATLPGSAGKPLAGSVAGQPLAAVQGRCAVVLPRCGSGLGVESDPEGASLAASLQEAVRAGSLSVKQAAASLASYLRQRQQAAAAAAIATAVAGSASSSPARGDGQPSSAGSPGSPLTSRSGSLTPFSMPANALAAAAAAAAGCSGSGLLGAESSLLAPSDSTQSVATSASLSHWASASSSLPMPAPPPLVSAPSWQQQPQQQQLVGSPVRDNDKLPLFMRRGTLRSGAALAGGGSGGGGSPSSTASHASSAGSGSFPGFPSRSGSPTPEPAKRVIAPPPGFGPPLGAAGIAALPRFR